jgi:GDP-mannose 6-dehydrogenase
VFDRNVRLASLVGANREYIGREIPHLSKLLVERLEDALENADVVVVGTDDPEVERIPSLLSEGQVLVDLCGRLVGKSLAKVGGICW